MSLALQKVSTSVSSWSHVTEPVVELVETDLERSCDGHRVGLTKSYPRKDSVKWLPQC